MHIIGGENGRSDREGIVTDAIILSDLHLGSDNCRARELRQFLEAIRRGDTPTKRLILNGDVFDSIDFRRLKKQHWKVLSLIRKLSDDVETVWVHGNHDGEFEFISHLLGVNVVEEYQFRSGDKTILCRHGHQSDEFISRYRFTTWFADFAYRWLQRLDKTHTFARYAKRQSKIFIRSTETIERGAIVRARQVGANVVCCGHTHLAAAKPCGPIEYYNSGCWTESPSHYLIVHGGVVELSEAIAFSGEDEADYEWALSASA